jgi:hypothetical protein
MRFVPSKKKSGQGGGPDPFSALTEANTDPTGPGIGVPREAPGLGKPASAKRVRPFAQTLGDTPPRDGPFAPSAKPVALNFPPKTRVNQYRKKNSGLDPFKNTGGVTK